MRTVVVPTQPGFLCRLLSTSYNNGVQVLEGMKWRSRTTASTGSASTRTSRMHMPGW